MAQLKDIDQGAQSFAVHDEQSREILCTSCIRCRVKITDREDRGGREAEAKVWCEGLRGWNAAGEPAGTTDTGGEKQHEQ